MNTLIFVMGIGLFFDNDIKMRNHKVFVIKRGVLSDDLSVGDNAEFEDISKMPMDIELLNFRVSRSMRRHGTTGNLIRIIRFIKAPRFRICLNFFDDFVGIFLEDKVFIYALYLATLVVSQK